MKKLTALVLALLLTLVPCAGLCQPASAARIDTDTVPTISILRQVSIYGVVPPVDGETPQFTGLEAAPGYIAKVRWYDVTAKKEMTETDTFQAGHTYNMFVYIDPDNDSVWKEESKGVAAVDVSFYSDYDGQNLLYVPDYSRLSYDANGTVSLDVHYTAECPSDSKAPVIVRQPQSAIGVSEGDTFSFSVTVEGTADTLKCDWYINDLDADPDDAGYYNPKCDVIGSESYAFSEQKVNGQTLFTMTVKNACKEMDGFGTYCIVTNSAGSTVSERAEIEFKGGKSLPFTDVLPGAWYRDHVVKAHKLGLINGKTDESFCPDDNMTYAEAIKLAACMNQLYNNGKVTLTNGSPNWYSSYVDYCLEKKIIGSDYADVINEKIDRQTYADIFAKALPDKALAAKNTIPDNAIPDVQQGNACYDSIYKLYRAGILNGSKSDGTFNPTDNIKRSEVSAILVRMMDSTTRVGAPAELSK